MLYDPPKSPLAGQQRVFSTLAHETAHQYQPVVNESQAAEAFDRITCDKGQAFVRMLEAYLGERAFRKGIQTYIATHQYFNTTSADLRAELGRTSGKPVAKIASDWTLQAGFPLIHVTARCNQGQRDITLRQQQFLLDQDAVSDRLWSVQYSAPFLVQLFRDIASLPDDARVKVLTDVSVLFDESLRPPPVFFGFIKALRPALRSLAIAVVQPQFKQLGWDRAEGESFDRARLRATLAPFLLQMGDEATLAEARSRFTRVLSEPQALSPDMLDVVVRAVGRHADQATFDRLLELARSVDGTEEKTRYYSAALSVTDPRLAAQALSLALSHEVPPLIASSDAAYADALEAFAKEHLPPDAMALVQRSAEGIRLRAQRKARMLAQLAQWLAPQVVVAMGKVLCERRPNRCICL